MDRKKKRRKKSSSHATMQNTMENFNDGNWKIMEIKNVKQEKKEVAGWKIVVHE